MAKQQNFPGVEVEIKDLEQIAMRYADIRDQRMELTTAESKLKVEALALMKKHKRRSYTRNGLEIVIEPGEEKIKVRVKKTTHEDEDEA